MDKGILKGTLIINDDYRVSKLVMEYVASRSLLII